VLVDYSVRVDAIATSQFKLTWQQGAELMAGPYKVNQRILLDIVDKQVRSRLNGLTTLASTGKLAESGGALQELAKAGWELYKVLFNAEGKGGNANAEAVEAGLRAASAGSTLCVFVQEHVYVPWGLVYDVEPAEHAVIDYEVYREHFWCLRFRLATVYDSSVGQDELAPEFDASGFDLIAGIDRTLLAKVAACASCGPELAAFEELRRQHGNHVHASSAADWLHLWKTHEARLGLLYFYGHSDQTTLSFGAGKKVNFIDFGYKYRKVTYPPLCLVFLNGCHTAEGDETGGFLEVTGSDGVCGFVGSCTRAERSLKSWSICGRLTGRSACSTASMPTRSCASHPGPICRFRRSARATTRITTWGTCCDRRYASRTPRAVASSALQGVQRVRSGGPAPLRRARTRHREFCPADHRRPLTDCAASRRDRLRQVVVPPRWPDPAP
jgi:hypothetical protein